MKRVFLSVVLLMVSAGLNAQTITVHNDSGVLLSDVVFTTREGGEVLVSFYGEKTVQVPENSVKFRIVSPSTYRNASTNTHDRKITTLDVPIMTFDDLAFCVTLDGSIHYDAELCVEEID